MKKQVRKQKRSTKPSHFEVLPKLYARKHIGFFSQGCLWSQGQTKLIEWVKLLTKTLTVPLRKIMSLTTDIKEAYINGKMSHGKINLWIRRFNIVKSQFFPTWSRDITYLIKISARYFVDINKLIWKLYKQAKEGDSQLSFEENLED